MAGLSCCCDGSRKTQVRTPVLQAEEQRRTGVLKSIENHESFTVFDRFCQGYDGVALHIPISSHILNPCILRCQYLRHFSHLAAWTLAISIAGHPSGSESEDHPVATASQNQSDIPFITWDDPIFGLANQVLFITYSVDTPSTSCLWPEPIPRCKAPDPPVFDLFNFWLPYVLGSKHHISG